MKSYLISFLLEYEFVKWSLSKISLSFIAFIGNLIQLLQEILFSFCKKSFNFFMKSFNFCKKFCLNFCKESFNSFMKSCLNFQQSMRLLGGQLHNLSRHPSYHNPHCICNIDASCLWLNKFSMDIIVVKCGKQKFIVFVS